MKKNKSCIIITTLILAVLFTILAGCDFASQADIDKEEVEKSIQYAKSAEQEREKITEEDKKYIDELYTEEQKEREQAEETELMEEEEELIPNEPVTYSGELDGVNIIIVINFKTTEVSGTVSYDDGNYWMDAEIVGIINIENFEVNSAFDGMCGSKEAGIGETWRGSIDGTVTGDLKTFNGTIIADDGAGGKFIASSNY